ncbi:hypothetical protein BCR44DRAFT_1523918 [Catenaria anguillulae PL171]|uniref:Uncharacterized protein n=1 Tax=Catenaria anguillulae PL171 TaxID=765915 RepID=A0A1Y2H5H3_9FUNG|nr:hypothetical protein BCR44DRAFT_1523918 [Catenaria anguillulae PL171]
MSSPSSKFTSPVGGRTSSISMPNTPRLSLLESHTPPIQVSTAALHDSRNTRGNDATASCASSLTRIRKTWAQRLWKRWEKLRTWIEPVNYQFPSPMDEARFSVYQQQKLIARLRITAIVSLFTSIAGLLVTWTITSVYATGSSDGTDSMTQTLLVWINNCVVRIKDADEPRALSTGASVSNARIALQVSNHNLVSIIFSLTTLRLQPRLHLLILALLFALNRSFMSNIVRCNIMLDTSCPLDEIRVTVLSQQSAESGIRGGPPNQCALFRDHAV